MNHPGESPSDPDLIKLTIDQLMSGWFYRALLDMDATDQINWDKVTTFDISRDHLLYPHMRLGLSDVEMAFWISEPLPILEKFLYDHCEALTYQISSLRGWGHSGAQQSEFFLMMRDHADQILDTKKHMDAFHALKPDAKRQDDAVHFHFLYSITVICILLLCFSGGR